MPPVPKCLLLLSWGRAVRRTLKPVTPDRVQCTGSLLNWSPQETLLRTAACSGLPFPSVKVGFTAHTQGACSQQRCGESPRAKLQRVSSEDRRTPVCGQAVKQSAEMRSALEFFATAQSCRERSLEKGLQERCLPIADRARLIVVKLRLPALGAVLTVFGAKNSSCVELECGTTPLVRGDSARSHFTLTLASEECSEVPRSTWQGRKTNRFPRQMVGVLRTHTSIKLHFSVATTQ